MSAGVQPLNADSATRSRCQVCRRANAAAGRGDGAGAPRLQAAAGHRDGPALLDAVEEPLLHWVVVERPVAARPALRASAALPARASAAAAAAAAAAWTAECTQQTRAGYPWDLLD